MHNINLNRLNSSIKRAQLSFQLLVAHRHNLVKCRFEEPKRAATILWLFNPELILARPFEVVLQSQWAGQAILGIELCCASMLPLLFLLLPFERVHECLGRHVVHHTDVQLDTLFKFLLDHLPWIYLNLV